MKTLVLSMISIAATVAAMTACTSESDPVNEVANNAEIKITASVLKAEVQSKAAVTGNTLEDVQILRKDVKTTEEESTIAWGTTPIVVKIADAQTSIFDDSNKQYYKPTGENAYFIGFYPAGTVSADGVVTFTNMTGKEDVLLSNKIDAGARGSVVSSSSLAFAHKLALVKFTFVKGTGYPDGDAVTELKVKGAELPATMKLDDGAMTYTTDKANNGIEAFTGRNYSISSPGTPISDDDILMIEPGKDISLDITTTKGTFKVTKVKINDNDSEKTAAGKQYNISITFNAAEANANATITGWGDAINGSGTTE